MLITAVPVYPGQGPEQIKIFARRALLLYPFHANEVGLNRYLYQKYNMTLKAACLQILLKSNYAKSKDKIIITIMDKKLDDIAHIITFGNGKIQGSKILQNILR